MDILKQQFYLSPPLLTDQPKFNLGLLSWESVESKYLSCEDKVLIKRNFQNLYKINTNSSNQR